MLDGLTSGLKAAYSTRKLLTAYAGSALKVQRASDNAQQDIGFSSGVLDIASLATFCSGTTGRVITWYDQNGGTNLTQATFANAPIIYQSGATNFINTTRPALLYAAATPTYFTNALSANPSNNLFQNAVVAASLATTQCITGPNLSSGLEWRMNASGAMELLSSGASSIATSTAGATANVASVVEASFDGTTYAFWIDGTAKGTGSNATSFTARTLNLGVQDSDSTKDDGMTGSIGEYVAYDTVGALSSGTRTSIEANQKTYWGTP